MPPEKQHATGFRGVLAFRSSTTPTTSAPVVQSGLSFVVTRYRARRAQRVACCVRYRSLDELGSIASDAPVPALGALPLALSSPQRGQFEFTALNNLPSGPVIREALKHILLTSFARYL